MENHKILILSQTVRDDYNLTEWKKNGVDTAITLKECNVFLRGIRRLWIKYGIPFESIWYGTWKKNLKMYDLVIINGNYLSERIPKWCRKEEKCPRIIWWYWNKVSALDNPNDIKNSDAEKWSFDPEDCNLYGMQFNTQYYFESFKLPKDACVENDIYYLGSNGGRTPEILAFVEEAKKQGLSLDVNIYEPKKTKWINDADINYIVKCMDYEENLCHIGKSNAILEIVRPGQKGQTLRAMEALFHQKKLITNDVTIFEKDYYRPENIFVLGKDRISYLKDFFELPFIPVEKEIKEYYDAQNWLKRFG